MWFLLVKDRSGQLGSARPDAQNYIMMGVFSYQKVTGLDVAVETAHTDSVAVGGVGSKARFISVPAVVLIYLLLFSLAESPIPSTAQLVQGGIQSF